MTGKRNTENKTTKKGRAAKSSSGSSRSSKSSRSASKSAKSSSKTAKSTAKSSSRAKAEPLDEEEKRAQVREEMRKAHTSKRIRDVISGLVYIALGVFIFASIQFQATGEFGNQLGIVLKGVFGLIGLVLPWYLIILGLLFITGKALHFTQRTLWMSVGVLLILCVMNAGRFLIGVSTSKMAVDIVQFYNEGVKLQSGGAFGMTVGSLLVKFLGIAGLYILCTALLLICLLLLLNTPISAMITRRRQRREEDRRLEQLMNESIADRSYQEELERQKREASLTIRGPQDLEEFPDTSDAPKSPQQQAMPDSLLYASPDAAAPAAAAPAKKHGLLHSILHSQDAEARLEKAHHVKKPSNVVAVMHQNPLGGRTQELSAHQIAQEENGLAGGADGVHYAGAGTSGADLFGGSVNSGSNGSSGNNPGEPTISFGAYDIKEPEEIAERDRIIERERSGSYGLDPVTAAPRGYGLDGGADSGSGSSASGGKGYGLEPSQPAGAGYGLSDTQNLGGAMNFSSAAGAAGDSGASGDLAGRSAAAGSRASAYAGTSADTRTIDLPWEDGTYSAHSNSGTSGDAGAGAGFSRGAAGVDTAGGAADEESEVPVSMEHITCVHQNADGEWVSNNPLEETDRNTMTRVLKNAEQLMREEQARTEEERGIRAHGAAASSVGAAAGGAAAGSDGRSPSSRPTRSTMHKKSDADGELSGAAMAGAAAKSIQKKTKFIYRKPSLDLLNPPELPDTTGLNQQLRQKARVLEETLESFHVDAHVVQVTQGPAVTRYEIQPGPGVKVSKIVGLSDDIALNLKAKSIRIEAPIPGKAAVGIEVENERIQMVRIREIIGSREFKQAKSKISFAVGKDIAGNAIVADLKGMPHLLIAGATGSGKSVCINSIITSILYKASPDEVRLVLIDPKVVELGNYNGIPHLLIPVVTDPGKAAAALNWAVSEMTDRYKKFADENVRDLSTYNDKMKNTDREDQKMPQVVIIIDELADLMMAAPNQVEESICRLAQLARAAGMHLIVATQRPSVDIITGLIKANIPSRIAFAVSSQFDSRTILDMNGAEKLVGKGDMLFNPQGSSKPLRVQGTFISDEEINRVIDFVKAQTPQEEATYNEEVIQDIEQKAMPGGSDSADELLPEAISCVVQAERASTSMLQRHFRIGYNRAARIMDEMEERGIVSPQDGSHPRQVLLTQEELDEMNGSGE